MAGEAQIRSSLQILKKTGAITQINYQSRPTSFKANVAGTKGPSPGAVTVTVAGTDIDFSELTDPGLCHLHNQDAVNFVEYGVWDPEGNTFYPLGELLPGEAFPLRLSRNLQQEFGTGTGTSGADTNRLRLKADTASVSVLVEAFER